MSVFSVLFPVIFVLIKGSNLYSSWRQFLFIYPSIIVISALGFWYLYDYLKYKKVIFRAAALLVFIILSFHPLKYMSSNLSYWYIYYNQLVGGLKGAYGNYETDYYYVSQTEASEWLINYLKEKGDTDNIKVKATYSVNWQFRKFPGIETSYFRYEEKSFSDWDYAIVTNRYISPYQLKNKLWPPENTIHLVYADSIPLCAVMERKSKSDYYGYQALNEENSTEAIEFLCEAVRINGKDEMIFFNLAAALVNNGKKEKADSVLKEGLRLNPGSEPILMYLGNIAKSEKRNNEAMRYYEKLISLNRKYFEAYVKLAELTAGSDMLKARDLLRRCLILNPAYKPAIITLAGTYRNSDRDIAAKYDELAKSIK